MLGLEPAILHVLEKVTVGVDRLRLLSRSPLKLLLEQFLFDVLGEGVEHAYIPIRVNLIDDRFNQGLLLLTRWLTLESLMEVCMAPITLHSFVGVLATQMVLEGLVILRRVLLFLLLVRTNERLLVHDLRVQRALHVAWALHALPLVDSLLGRVQPSVFSLVGSRHAHRMLTVLALIDICCLSHGL